MTSRPTTAPILAVLAIVLVTLGAYVGGYFRLGRFSESGFLGKPDGRSVVRMYPYAWQSDAFAPLGRIERWLTGRDVFLWSEED